MYAIAFVLTGMLCIMDIGGMVNFNVATFGIAIRMGILGNSIYYKHMNEKIVKIQKSYQDTDRQKVEIGRTGGTSWAGVALVVLVQLIIGGICGYIEDEVLNDAYMRLNFYYITKIILLCAALVGLMYQISKSETRSRWYIVAIIGGLISVIVTIRELMK